MQHIYEEIGWYLVSKGGGGSGRVAPEGATGKNALPSHVRLLNLADFRAYSTTGEDAIVAWDVDTRWILDSSCVPGSRDLVRPNHGLTVGRVGPMLVMNVLRGGVGLMAVSGREHDCRTKGWGRVGRGGQSFGR